MWYNSIVNIFLKTKKNFKEEKILIGCSHIMDNGKCSFVGHFYSKEGFTINSTKVCMHGKNNLVCKFYEEELSEDLVVDESEEYKDFDSLDEEVGVAKIKKKKVFI